MHSIGQVGQAQFNWASYCSSIIRILFFYRFRDSLIGTVHRYNHYSKYILAYYHILCLFFLTYNIYCPIQLLKYFYVKGFSHFRQRFLNKFVLEDFAMIEFEKRMMERFSLELHTYLSMADENGEQESIDLLTSNVCAGGAFFKTKKPLSIGTNVKIGMILPLDKFKNLKGKRSCIDVAGSVIRTDNKGMAICFGKRYKILPCP